MSSRPCSVFLMLSLSVVAGCSNSGGCGGMAPLPGGFPPEQRLPNSLQMRLTDSGLSFLQDNLLTILASKTEGPMIFPLESMHQSIADICADTACFVSTQVKDLRLEARAPNQLAFAANLQVWSSDGAGTQSSMPLFISLPDIPLMPSVEMDCRITINTGEEGMPVNGVMQFDVDPLTGFTSFSIPELNAANGLQKGHLDIEGGFGCSVTEFFLGLFMGSLRSGMNDRLQTMVGEFNCKTCETSADCPNDAACTDGQCQRGGRCVNTLLGLEGRMALGSLLGEMGSGNGTTVDMIMAAGGYAQTNGGGLSLSFHGGAEPTRRAACVPLDSPAPPVRSLPPLRVIQETNTCPTCEDPQTHAVMAVSESMLNRFALAFHQGGALCLTLPANAMPLTTSSLGMVMPSIKNLTWGENAPVRVELRPGIAPSFEIGAGTPEDPLLGLSLPQVSLDFYAWVHDRWARLISVTMDVGLQLNLRPIGGELEVEAAGLEVQNLTVDNSSLVKEDPADLAAALQGVFDLMLGPQLQNLDNIELPELAGFDLSIPAGGLGYVQESDEEFLLIYSKFAPAARMAAPMVRDVTVETQAVLTELEVPPTEDFAATDGPPVIPRVSLSLNAQRAHSEPVEYRTRLDHGIWSVWSSEPTAVVQKGALLFQGRHLIEAQARVAGRPETADPSPAQLEVVIDTVSPEITLQRLGDQYVGSSEGRTADNATESGVALRGRLPTTSADGAAGCSMTGSSPQDSSWLLLVLLLGGWLARRRLRAVPSLGLLVACLAVTACSASSSKSDDEEFVCDFEANPNCCHRDEDCLEGRCCPGRHECVAYTEEHSTCESGMICAEMPPLNDSCVFEPCSSCAPPETVPLGQVGLHSSVAGAPDGSVWVAGYAAGRAPGRGYGDLVVAHVSRDASRVPDEAWESVDGVPEDAEVIGDPKGWRGGRLAPGRDVGKYTSVAVNNAGQPAVAYYDQEAGRLKFVSRGPSGWHPPVVVDGVEPEVDAGMYADLSFLASGLPAIVYRVTERFENRVISRVRFVQALDTVGARWATPVDLDVMDPTPCGLEDCSSGSSCDLVTGQCVVPTDDCQACAEGEVCVSGACHAAAVVPSGLPEGTGIWPDLAAGPQQTLGVVFYNHTDGNLIGVSFDGNQWGAPQVLAGETGDVGWSPSLDIDTDGVWHMTAVDGVSEDLLYLNSRGAREVIDGRSLGQHANLRGDDSSIVVLPDGRIRVAYQDTTDLQLWMAERDASGIWTPRQLQGQGIGEDVAQGFYVGHARLAESTVASGWYFDPRSDSNGVLLFWLD